MLDIDDDLLRRVKTFAEQLAIQNHGLPQQSGDILRLVWWAEEVRKGWGLKPVDWRDGGTIG